MSDGPGVSTLQAHLVVEEYWPFIYRIALGLLRHPEDAEDAAQDVVVRVLRFFPSFSYRAGLTTWLYRITHNVCMNMLRERQRWSRWEDLADRGREADGWCDEVHERLVLMQALETLPAKYRLPLTQFVFEHKPCRQIAHELRLPVSTVKVRIHRGRILLRELLTGQPDPARPCLRLLHGDDRRSRPNGLASESRVPAAE